MKKITFLVLLFFCACVPDEDYELPEMPRQDISLETNTDLHAILGTFYQSRDKFVTFEQDYTFEAYVVSSDEAGNFYKELVVQDKPENPTAGITIKINLNSYFQYYNFGRKVYVNVKGLSIADVNGVATLGVASGKQVENIPQSQVSEHLIRTSEVAEIKALPVTALEFSDQLENLYVRVENVQFNKMLVNPANTFTFASEANDEFDGERLVESCAGDFPFILSTSTYSDFKAFQLPNGSGSIEGVLTRDFYDDFYTIYVNSPADIHFSDSTRCDPPEFDCGKAETTGSKILFFEDFTSEKNNKPVAGNGWTNFLQEGSKQWEGFTATGENASLGRSARMKPAGSGDRRSISWLITPQINFDRYTGEVLSFKTSTSFADGSLLDVLISTDWDGEDETILQADWKILSSAYIAQNSDFFGDWLSSGNVDLSCTTGRGYIAFRYSGSDQPNYDGIYELDDITISAE